ncbi:hypothetical protein KQ303_05500 [Synechococcus sp. CS-1333]|nr:hypothetical protein [Synechococcus sp. CS-1333]
MSKDLLDLESIAEASKRIRCYTQDGRASFLESTLHQDGVIRNLIVIGEMERRQERHPQGTPGADVGGRLRVG